MSDPARKIRTTLQAIQHLTTATNIRLGPTLKALTSELAAHDGYPSTASGSDTGSHSPFIPTGPNASTSSTERCAINPDLRNDTDTWSIGPRAVLAEIQSYLDAAVHALETVCRECDLRTPGLSEIDISRLRCAVIPKGACTQWADPAQTDGLCIDHHRQAETNARRLRDHRARSA